MNPARDILYTSNLFAKDAFTKRDQLVPPRQVYNFTRGGRVDKSQVNIDKAQLKIGDPDRVLARLQPGELVIPVKHVKKVTKMLKKEKIKLPGMK